MKHLNILKDFDFAGKRVLVRVDLNVPIARGKIVDTSRIERIIPTIKYLADHGAKIILLSHFGRPKGKFDLSMSLAPLVDSINSFLDGYNQVSFCVDPVGETAEEAVSNMSNSDILLLENLRFYAGEEANDPEFTKSLAKLGDIFINDTFSCSHRSHASIVGLASVMPCGIGLLFAEEITQISNILKTPQAPVAAIIGGSKISTKLDLLYSLVEKYQLIIIGGGMANTFLKSQNIAIGQSICEDNLLDEAQKILSYAKQHNCKIILPDDVVVADDINASDGCSVVDINNIPQDKMILDIGPETCVHIVKDLLSYKTVIWNGPLGAFEYRPFNISTEMVARVVASYTTQEKMVSIAGGGDVVAAIKASSLENSFTYLSTAGGAFLEWLEGKITPGIKALKDHYQDISINPNDQIQQKTAKTDQIDKLA